MEQRVIKNREKLIKLFEKNPPNFYEGKFRGVRVAGGVFRNVNFEKADFRDADLRETDFTKVNFASADFTGAKLSKACLQNADLTRSFLIRVYMNQAQLQNANLTKAFLCDSDLSQCQLKNANLTHAIINGANFGEVHDLTQDQLNACVFITSTGDIFLNDVRGLDFQDNLLPTLPEGMKPSFMMMTYKEWLALEEQSELLAV